MISSAQMEAQNLNLQEQVKSVLGLIVNIGMILMVLWVIVILVRNADGDIAGYCG
jgi:flagellar biogenesis protein FliO